jgi:hypothetical protein
MAGMRLGYTVSTKENIGAMREHALWNNANAAVLEGAPIHRGTDACRIPIALAESCRCNSIAARTVGSQ